VSEAASHMMLTPQGQDMVAHVLEFAAGPGLDGFIAWVEQIYPEPVDCVCGEKHGTDREALVRNLTNLAQLLEEGLRS
jgi:hypothetical protein